MGKTKVRKDNMSNIGNKELSLQEKLIIIRERFKRNGDCVYVSLGANKLSYSRWVNGVVKGMRKEMKEAIIEISDGFITEADFDTIPHRATSIPKPAKKQPPKRTVTVDEDFDLIL